jgi:uncharacterized protein (TIGR02453 family)
MSRFAGIPADAVAFYAELEANTTREWFAAHKDRYERSVREPILALTEALEAEFGPARLFRPYVDVRFRTDKTPVKTEQAAVVEGGHGSEDTEGTGGTEGTGYYLQVSADGLVTGGGAMHHASDQIARLRAAVDDERSGAELAEVVKTLRRRFEIGGETLKRAPRGVDPDHPRIELMRHKSIIAWRRHGTPAWLSTGSVVRHVRDDWRAIRPLADWFAEHVGPTTSPVDERRPGGR